MLLCVMPILVWILVSRTSVAFMGWVIGAVALMVIGHLWLMRRGHKHDEESEDEINTKK